MSSRAARKLLKLREKELKTAESASTAHAEDVNDVGEEDGDDLSSPVAAPKKANLFALLNGEEFDADEDEDDTVEQLEEADQGRTQTPCDDEDEEGMIEKPSLQAKSSVKKKKKKKKTKGKSVESTEMPLKSVKGGKTHDTPKEEEMDEVEAALREINEKFGETTFKTPPSNHPTKTNPPRKSQKPLLGVEAKYLDADAEMRRMFGSKIVADDIKAKRYVRTGGAAAAVRTNLATPRDTWPRFDGRLGVLMRMVSAPSRGGDAEPMPGVFEFVYSQAYEEVQQIFQICVDSHDPQTLSNLLRSNPYHIDALLQLSEVARHNTDMSTAAEYIERALYTFERSFHTMFNPATAFCRLPYTHRQNRAFFLALSRQIGFVQKKGCWRTALELTKYMLALDPEDDALGAILLIDLFAIKAGEGGWFRRLWGEWAGEEDEGVVGLPNLEFGIAFVEREREVDEGVAHTRSTKLLRRALLAAVTDTKLTTHPIFTPPKDETPSESALTLLTKLFVERSHPLWKEPEVLTWLRATATSITSLPLDSVELSDAEKMRKTAYPDGVPLNVARHVFVSEFSGLVPLLPRSATGRGMNVFDPMPPDVGTVDPNFDAGAAAAAAGGGRAGLFGWIIQNVGALMRGGVGAEPEGEDEEDDEGDDGNEEEEEVEMEEDDG
ncbi:Transcription factor 25 [Dinochytrium kinnereticum]|nr:Transcription factor 25 [Dinochytrium kinnereticum]